MFVSRDKWINDYYLGKKSVLYTLVFICCDVFVIWLWGNLSLKVYFECNFRRYQYGEHFHLNFLTNKFSHAKMWFGLNANPIQCTLSNKYRIFILHFSNVCKKFKNCIIDPCLLPKWQAEKPPFWKSTISLVEEYIPVCWGTYYLPVFS